MKGMRSILSTRAGDRSYSFDAPTSATDRPRHPAADIVRDCSIAGSAVPYDSLTLTGVTASFHGPGFETVSAIIQGGTGRDRG